VNSVGPLSDPGVGPRERFEIPAVFGAAVLVDLSQSIIAALEAEASKFGGRCRPHGEAACL